MSKIDIKVALGRTYGDQDFDRYGLLKPSHWLWLVTLLLMRGWLLFVMAGVSREQGSLILAQFYPQHGQLGLALLLGLPALLLCWAVSLKHYKNSWAARYWGHGRAVVLLSLILDGANQLIAIFHLWRQGQVVNGWQSMLFMVTLWALLYMLRSHRSREAFRAHSAIDASHG